MAEAAKAVKSMEIEEVTAVKMAVAMAAMAKAMNRVSFGICVIRVICQSEHHPPPSPARAAEGPPPGVHNPSPAPPL